MPIEPQLVHRIPPFDFDGISQLGEDTVADVVASLPMREVCYLRTTLITRLRPKLHLQVPQMLLDRAEERFEDSTDGSLVVKIVVPLDDPSSIAPLINYPEVQEEIYFETDEAHSLVRVKGDFAGVSVEAASAAMASALSEYGRNIDRAAQHIERYNAALPYLISVSVQDRVDELSDRTRPDWDPATKSEFEQALAELVAEGKIVPVEEIDPQTGELLTRYHAAEQASISN